MRSIPILFLTALAIARPAAAQTDPAGQEIAREAAAAAVNACENLGFRVMATVVDRSGRFVAARVADAPLAQPLAEDSVHSAQVAAFFQDRSSRVPYRLTQEADVDYALEDHPQLAPITPGGVPFPGPDTFISIGVDGPPNRENLGAIGVAGAPDTDKDEECGLDGVTSVLQALK
jgi:uncharacterized protein GlcG (DUF336 family)